MKTRTESTTERLERITERLLNEIAEGTTYSDAYERRVTDILIEKLRAEARSDADRDMREARNPHAEGDSDE